MFETLIAISLLSIILVLASRMGSTMLHHRKQIQRDRVTLEAKTNLMTFAMATPYADVSEKHLQSFADTLITGDEKANWKIRVADLPIEGHSTTSTAKRISVDVSYGNETTESRKPVVAWRFPIAVRALEAEAGS